MTAQLIDGKALSQQLRADVKARADKLKAKNKPYEFKELCARR